METPDLEISFVLISSVFNKFGFHNYDFSFFLEKKKQFKYSNLYFNIDFSGKKEKKKKKILIFYSLFSFYFLLIKKENFFFSCKYGFYVIS